MGGDDARNLTHGESAIRASEAFSVLGNETRLSILLALWEAYDPFAAEHSVPFSQLRDSVGIRDSGQFNYHLGKLVGQFIEQSNKGYRLTRAGLTFVQVVVAGTVSRELENTRSEIDESCPRCGATVLVTYGNDEVTVECTECPGFFQSAPNQPGHIFQFGFPPAGFADRTSGDVLRAAFSYQLHRIEAMMDGVCPTCGGRIETWVDLCEDHDVDSGLCDSCGSSFMALARWRCRTCKASMFGPSWEPVLNHPAVVAFYYNHGIEHDHSTWATARRGVACTEELVSTSPFRLRITVEVDDDYLHVTVDEALTVRDIREGD